MANPQLERLFASLQQVFKRDPIPRPAISISFSLANAAAFLTINNHTLSIVIEETNTSTSPFDFFYRDRPFAVSMDTNGDIGRIKPIVNLTYDLRQWTLEALIENIN